MTLRVDHVTIAGPGLGAMRSAFEAAGLPFEYGGAHSNGITHMALLGFDDGSYIELISTLEPGARSPLWDEQIRADAGPAAWAIEVEDVAAEAARLRALGVTVRGPLDYRRETPDGRVAEWEMAFPGTGSPGATIPFFLHDRTPREWRVRPSSAVAATGLTGVAGVVLGVSDLEASIGEFRRLYGWVDPVRQSESGWGARLARFAGTPVVLAAPLDSGGWLAERLDSFGELPCAFLLASEDPGASAGRLPIASTGEWLGRTTAWLDMTRIGGMRLGVAG